VRQRRAITARTCKLFRKSQIGQAAIDDDNRLRRHETSKSCRFTY